MEYSINQRRVAFIGIILFILPEIVSIVVLNVYKGNEYDTLTNVSITIHYINNILVSVLMLPVLIDIVNNDRDSNETCLTNLLTLIRIISFSVFASSAIMCSLFVLGDGRIYPEAIFILIESCIIVGVPTIIISFSTIVLITMYMYECIKTYYRCIDLEKLKELLPSRNRLESIRLEDINI